MLCEHFLVISNSFISIGTQADVMISWSITNNQDMIIDNNTNVWKFSLYHVARFNDTSIIQQLVRALTHILKYTLFLSCNGKQHDTAQHHITLKHCHIMFHNVNTHITGVYWGSSVERSWTRFPPSCKKYKLLKPLENHLLTRICCIQHRKS